MRSRVPVIADNSNPQKIAEVDKLFCAIGKYALNINVEAYPTLRSTGLLNGLQIQIEWAKNHVAVVFGDWNCASIDYNVKAVKFSGNIIPNT